MQSLLSKIETQFNASLADVVTRICEEYKLPLEEVKTKFLEHPTHPSPIVKKTRVKKTPIADRPVCPCFARSGDSCKNRCIEGQPTCKTHFGKKPEETGKIVKEKKPRVNKSKKVKKVGAQPLHNHDPHASSASCEVCVSHGNILTEETYDDDEVSIHARVSKTVPVVIDNKNQTIIDKISSSTSASPGVIEKGLSMLDNLIEDDDAENNDDSEDIDDDEDHEIVDEFNEGGEEEQLDESLMY